MAKGETRGRTVAEEEGGRACLVQQQWKLKTIKNVLLTHVDGGGGLREEKQRGRQKDEWSKRRPYLRKEKERKPSRRKGE